MSNGFGPLLRNLDAIQYEDREYWLRGAWTSFENYVEICGLDNCRPAGPWGSREIDCERGRVILPTDVAVKVAAAILYAEVYDGEIGPAERLTDAFADEDQAAFRRVLQRILRNQLDNETDQPPQQAIALDDPLFADNPVA